MKGIFYAYVLATLRYSAVGTMSSVKNSEKSLMSKVHLKMAVQIAGEVAILNKESVTGVERKVGAVNMVWLEMDVMVPLEDQAVIDAYLNQVSIV